MHTLTQLKHNPAPLIQPAQANPILLVYGQLLHGQDVLCLPRARQWYLMPRNTGVLLLYDLLGPKPPAFLGHDGLVLSEHDQDELVEGGEVLCVCRVSRVWLLVVDICEVGVDFEVSVQSGWVAEVLGL